MAEDSVAETTFTAAREAIANAVVAQELMEAAYTRAFDEFAGVRQAYQKFTGAFNVAGNTPDNIMGLVKKYAPTALKYFGAGGAGAGVLLALAQDGTGAGILSRIGGIFGIGGP